MHLPLPASQGNRAARGPLIASGSRPPPYPFVSLSSPDGARVASSTGIDILLLDDFKLVINDTTHHVRPPRRGEAGLPCRRLPGPSDFTFWRELKPPRLCRDHSSELLPHEEAERLNDVKYLVQQLYTTLRIEDHQLGKERELIGRLEDLNSQLRPLEKVEPNFFHSDQRSFHTGSEFALASNLLKSMQPSTPGAHFLGATTSGCYFFHSPYRILRGEKATG